MNFLSSLSTSELLIFGLGFFAQSLFGARTVSQWIISEREGRVVSPTIFWLFSLGGCFLFLIYGVLRSDVVILFGQTIAFYIYIRNLQLKGFWKRLPEYSRLILFCLPPALFLYISITQIQLFNTLFDSAEITDVFLLTGAIGQLLLNFRYLYQWYHSEKANESLLPMGFWVISAIASVMVVVYGYYRHDPVLLVAQGLGLFAYLRNIYWSYKNSSRQNI